MAAPRGRGPRPGGVVRALLRLFLLIAIGFGVGLASGVVMEEPELLAGHLRGDSESVSLDARAPESAAPDVGASPLEKGRETPRDGSSDVYASAATGARPLDESTARVAVDGLPAVASPRAAGPAQKPERSAAAGRALVTSTPPASALRAVRGDTRWSIQIGAFSEQASATRLAEGLRARYPVAILPANAKSERWRVRVQPIESKQRAQELAEKLKRDEGLPTWVTRMEGRSGS